MKDAAADRPISFQLDVMPVFMRAGCNTGSCHGAARGKDGFRLSLFGFDPQGDYYRLTREIGVRRINLASPKDSLLIEKTIGAVPHTGGKRFDAESEYHATLMQWLEAGAPNDAAPTPAVLGVDLYPPQRRARRRRGHAAVHRPGPLCRRHRPRHHVAGHVHDQQRQLGPDHAGRPGHRRLPAARPSSWPASRRTPSATRCSCCPRD